MQKIATEIDRGLCRGAEARGRWYGLGGTRPPAPSPRTKSSGVSADDVKAIDQAARRARRGRPAGDVLEKKWTSAACFKTTINLKTEASAIDDEKDRNLARDAPGWAAQTERRS